MVTTVLAVVGLLAYPIVILHDVARHQPVPAPTQPPVRTGMTADGVPYVVNAAEPRGVGCPTRGGTFESSSRTDRVLMLTDG